MSRPQALYHANVNDINDFPCNTIPRYQIFGIQLNDNFFRIIQFIKNGIGIL